MDFISSVRRTLRVRRLLAPGTRTVAAVSGGADSVALLFALDELSSGCGFQLAGVAHLNHELRGSESDGDEAFCRELAARVGVPIEVERCDVAAEARAARVSVEQAAHAARHAFFARAAHRLDAASVCVAHTKDDQAETLLLRLLRGAGPRGLGGMHLRSGIVVRPMLETGRHAVRAFLAERGLTFREDSTNADRTIPRNRVRHELLPLLEARFAPSAVDILARAAAIAREDAEYLEAAAERAAAGVVSPGRDGLVLDAEALLDLPQALSRRIVLAAQRAVAGDRFLGFEAADAVLQFAVSKEAGPLDLPGHRVNRRGGRVVLRAGTSRGAARGEAAFTYLLPIPGRVSVPEANCAISADIQTAEPGRAADVVAGAAAGTRAVLDRREVSGPLSVRNRRPGDRLQPLGMRGTRKIQDVLVDAKVPPEDREKVPVVVDAGGRIAWVVGHAVAEPFRVSDTTRDVVILNRVPI